MDQEIVLLLKQLLIIKLKLVLESSTLGVLRIYLKNSWNKFTNYMYNSLKNIFGENSFPNNPENQVAYKNISRKL